MFNGFIYILYIELTTTGTKALKHKTFCGHVRQKESRFSDNYKRCGQFGYKQKPIRFPIHWQNICIMHIYLYNCRVLLCVIKSFLSGFRLKTNKKNLNHSKKLFIQNYTHGSCIYKFIQLQPKTILVVRFYSIKILNT